MVSLITITETGMPFFSVIVTTYNREIELEKCIHSILQQSFTDFELLVIDDCSTDKTQDVIAQFGSSVRSFVTDINTGGPAIPRNKGIQNAKGEWLCFCDSDDRFTPGHLENIYSFIQKSRIFDGIISANALLLKSDKITTDPYFENIHPGFRNVSFNDNWNTNRSILSSLSIRNYNVVPFREQPKYRSVEDYIFLLENMLHGKRHYATGEPTILYNDTSVDSIRVVGNGNKLHEYKAEIFWQYKLWKRKNGLQFLGIIFRDGLKFRLKKMVKAVKL
jgi:glycosyltransferase involved in cell wall biosynthesis